ncbi:hypothetical protein GCM10029992_49340 [Glycomyces albus]
METARSGSPRPGRECSERGTPDARRNADHSRNRATNQHTGSGPRRLRDGVRHTITTTSARPRWPLPTLARHDHRQGTAREGDAPPAATQTRLTALKRSAATRRRTAREHGQDGSRPNRTTGDGTGTGSERNRKG